MKRLLLLTVFGMAFASQAAAQVPSVSPFPRQQAEEDTGPQDVNTGVSFIDMALPQNMLRLRFDLDSRNVRPTRAEYLFPADGFARPERRVDVQDLRLYAEYAAVHWFSVFADTPYRWLNPDFNDNTHGVGDLLLGFKLMTWQDDNFFATFQFKLSLPTAGHDVLGTDHVTAEPGFLAHYNLFGFASLDGELRYSVPIGGTDYAGDVLRYGLGLTFGQRSWNQAWITPVAEVNGWTVMNGKAQAYEHPPTLFIENARGDTIINLSAGVRFGWNEHMDIFAGYSRAITGEQWFRDTIRLELRWLY